MSESKGGGLDPELRMDLSNYNDRVTPGRANQITLARVNTPTRNILKKFDNNGDGRIDANEIQTIVSTLVAEKFKSKAFKIGLIILCVFTAILLGAMFGLTWAVVAALKDTQVQGGVLVTNDRNARQILVANTDLTVAEGNLVSRNTSTVLKTAKVQTPGTISGRIPFDKLLAMQNLVFQTGDNSSFAVAIQGIAKVPSSSAREGYIVVFQTASGVLTYQDGTWSVSNMTGPLLEGLFNVTEGDQSTGGTRRRLSAADKVLSYVICENGECGEAIPCGADGWDACPTDITSNSNSGDTGSGDENSGLAGGGCTKSTPPVYYCSAGMTSCYGATPSIIQRTRYMGQAFCTSNCDRIGWVYNSQYKECEGSTLKQFCCV